MYGLSIKPFGEFAALIEWPNEVSSLILDDILSFQGHLLQNYLSEEDWEAVPAYNSLTLISRKKKIKFSLFPKQLQQWYLEKRIENVKNRYLWKLPVCYDASFGIDILEVCAGLQLSVEDVIRMHTESVYTIYGIGFLPGFVYFGGLSKALEIPRRATPRLKVVQGAVGLAGKQTGVYPQNSPGGWNIIGNCPVPLFMPEKENPCFVSVGDKVQFYEVSKAVYKLLKIEIETGVFVHKKTVLND